MKAARFWLGYGLLLALLLGAATLGLSQWQLGQVSALVAERLMLLNELRRDALNEYFQTAEAELRFWSISPDILEAQSDFQAIWASAADRGELENELRREFGGFDAHSSVGTEELALREGGGPEYGWRHHQLHPLARQFVLGRGYYDFFLIGLDGTIYYTVEKESDFAGRLTGTALADSHLAQVWRRALALPPGQVATSDMWPSAPSNDDPAIFMALALRDGLGEAIGVIAFQLPTARLVEIMNYRSGMGETGETYLVGRDRLMRSNSRFVERSTILQQSVDTSTVAEALAGNEGYDYVPDYRGIEVLSAYTRFELDGIQWAMMAEMDRAEVVEVAARDRPSMAGVLAFVYGLALWSAWYWRGRQMPQDGFDPAALDYGADASDGFSAD